MLTGLDALVFDMQDVGTRYYTYATTMAYAMEAAAQYKLDFFVLDRPNPITGSTVQGPVLDADLVSFITYLPAVRHETIGEPRARSTRRRNLRARLHVVKMRTTIVRHGSTRQASAWWRHHPICDVSSGRCSTLSRNGRSGERRVG
jgi:uncharacterized protein YbbC (DUF1343 family)